MNEYVVAAVTLNKAEAFSVVEPFNYALFTSCHKLILIVFIEGPPGVANSRVNKV
jgi:hypothetical protein